MPLILTVYRKILAFYIFWHYCV